MIASGLLLPWKRQFTTCRTSLYNMAMSAMNKKRTHALATTLSKKLTHFTTMETECLILEFYELLEEKVKPGTEKHGLGRERFKIYLHDSFGISNDIITDGIFRTFDKDTDGFISLEEWINGMAVFLQGTLDEKIKHCFSVYDLNGDEHITREEMYYMLKDCLPGLPSGEERDEVIEELVEIPMKEMDTDRDGKVTLEEFEAAVTMNNLLLQALGRCLPDTMGTEKFKQHVFKKHLE